MLRAGVWRMAQSRALRDLPVGSAASVYSENSAAVHMSLIVEWALFGLRGLRIRVACEGLR